MNAKTITLAIVAAAASVALLSGCEASDEPLLEKGEPAGQSRSAEQAKKADKGEPTPEVPEECFDAFDDASRVDDLLSQGLQSASRSIEYAMDYDSYGLDEENAKIESLIPKAEDARTDFAVAAAVCETGGAPEVCVDALDDAEDIDDYLSEALQSASRALGYTLDYDGQALDEETELLRDIQADLEQARSDFDDNSFECASMAEDL